MATKTKKREPSLLFKLTSEEREALVEILTNYATLALARYDVAEMLRERLKNCWEEFLSERSWIDDARKQHGLDGTGKLCEGELEIDDDALVSVSDNGAYVQAWLWVEEQE